MDLTAMKDIFGSILLWGCIGALVGVGLAGICLFLSGLPMRVLSAGKKYGWPAVLILGGLMAWAAIEGTPTNEDKEDGDIQSQQQNMQNAALADGMAGGNIFSGLHDGNLTTGGQAFGAGENWDGCMTAGTLPSNGAPASGDAHEIEELPNIRWFMHEDRMAGIALAKIGTNETWNFSPPEGAEICEDWRRFGAAEDWFRTSFTNGWSFAFGTNRIDAMTVFSYGTARPNSRDASTHISPFRTSLGIVPYANQPLPGDGDAPSQYWQAFTPSNTFVMTWQNVLFNRDVAMPVSFQAEFWEEGRIIFRYDLSRIEDDVITNLVVGILNDGNGRTFTSLEKSTTSLRWEWFDGMSSDTDPDDDNISTEDEILVYGTNPYKADTDGDGISDNEEINTWHTDPSNAYSVSDLYCDGIAVKIGNEDPFSYPQESTNTILEHVFYTGTTNAPFVYPQASPARAILKVSCSGSGHGTAFIGDRAVPLVGRTSAGGGGGGAMMMASPMDRGLSPEMSFLVEVMLGEDIPVVIKADGTLTIEYNSSHFAFGELPSRYNGFGYVNFPNTVAETPCIHDFSARRKQISLPVRKDANDLTCTWSSTGGVTIENMPPRSALITAEFSARNTKSITYTLEHPKYLFGETKYMQTVRFCPQFPDSDDEEDWETGGGGGGGNNDDDDDDDNDDDDNENHEQQDDDNENQSESCCSCHDSGTEELCSCGCSRCCWTGDGTDDDDDDDDNDKPETTKPLPPQCPKHHVPFSQCEYLHDDEYETAQNCDELNDVLLIRDPKFYYSISLDVPNAANNCCSCPSHASNYVEVVRKDSGLEVLDKNGLDFRWSASSCEVKVAGIKPSSKVSDTKLAFARNGKLYEERSYTIFGVGITKNAIDGDRLPIYNTLSFSLGYPFTVNTNLWSAPMISLNTHVKLPNRNIHVKLEDVTGQFTLWYYDRVLGKYRVLLDSDSGGTMNVTFRQWRWLCNRRTAFGTAELPVLLTSESAGSARLVFRYWNVLDGKFAYDEVSQRITSINPPLLADVNHDGKIDTNDIASCISGELFEFWNNDETVKGDYAGESSDNILNSSDLVVNGTYDLPNFFPMAVNLSDLCDKWGDQVTYRIEPVNPVDGLFKYCFAVIPKNDMATCQTTDAKDILGSSLKNAPLTSLDKHGNVLSEATIKMLSGDDKVMFVEAVFVCQEMKLTVSFANVVIYSYTMPIDVRSLRNMYCTVNLCDAARNENFMPSIPGEYEYRDLMRKSDGTHFFFAHGYNVNPADAMTWHDQMFKRLWWAGSKSMYTGIIWHGCESQIQAPVAGGVTPDYYVNVVNAFKTAPHLATVISILPGTRKYLAAHSLGNMMASSAIVDYGLNVNKYFMFNAAVPMEAYNPAAVTEESHVNMTPAKWRAYDDRLRASHWHELFNPSDARNSLTWKGRFVSIQNAVNYYSSEEDVLNNSDGISHSIIASNYAWANQELNKGVWPALIPGNNEGGWEFNIHYMVNNPYLHQGGSMYLPRPPAQTENISTNELKVIPFFGNFDDMSICGTNLVTSIPNRAQLLADAIPAESYATGRNPIPGWSVDGSSNENKNMTSCKYAGLSFTWTHSAIKRMAYFWIHELFEDIVQRKER